MRVKDIMSSPVYTVERATTVDAAAALMTAKSVTALPVLDESGAVVGMVGESDLLWHRVPADPAAHLRPLPAIDPADRPGLVVEVMSPYPVTVRPDTDVAEAAEAMLEYDVRSIPVLDDGDLVGIVSRRDILRAMVRGDDVLTAEVQHRLDEYADGQHRWTATVEGGVARIAGDFDDITEQGVVAVLASTVPGVAAVDLNPAPATRSGG
jgi:CBS domain-containing protein